jgi:hypothetical protein
MIVTISLLFHSALRLAPKENDTTPVSRTIVTFADLFRESPAIITSTEPSFVVLIDDCKLF